MQEGGELWGPDLREMAKKGKEALSSRHAGEDGVPVLMTADAGARYYVLSNPRQGFSQSVMDPTGRYSPTGPGWKSE